MQRSLKMDVMLFVHIDFSLKGREVTGYVAMVMDFLSLSSLRRWSRSSSGG